MRFDGSVETPLSGPRPGPPIAPAGRSRASARSRCATCTPTAIRRHERETRRLLARLLPGAYVSLSSDVLPQIKEYERFCTTVVNAYVGPVLGRYLGRLGNAPAEGGLSRATC